MYDLHALTSLELHFFSHAEFIELCMEKKENKKKKKSLGNTAAVACIIMFISPASVGNNTVPSSKETHTHKCKHG